MFRAVETVEGDFQFLDPSNLDDESDPPQEFAGLEPTPDVALRWQLTLLLVAVWWSCRTGVCRCLTSWVRGEYGHVAAVNSTSGSDLLAMAGRKSILVLVVIALLFATPSTQVILILAPAAGSGSLTRISTTRQGRRRQRCALILSPSPSVAEGKDVGRWQA